MMGAWAEAHHTETQVLKVDDLSSPLTAMFNGKDFEHNDEFYHMPVYSPYSREKQHILAAVQYILGDLTADATPSGSLKSSLNPPQVKGNSSVRSGL